MSFVYFDSVPPGNVVGVRPEHIMAFVAVDNGEHTLLWLADGASIAVSNKVDQVIAKLTPGGH